MPNRPEQNEGETPRKKTGCGFLYLTDCTSGDYPEIFLKLGKTGGCPAAFLQALAMVISLGLRRKLEREDVIKALKDIGCPNPCWDGGKQISSCPDAISKMLEERENAKCTE